MILDKQDEEMALAIVKLNKKYWWPQGTSFLKEFLCRSIYMRDVKEDGHDSRENFCNNFIFRGLQMLQSNNIIKQEPIIRRNVWKIFKLFIVLGITKEIDIGYQSIPVSKLNTRKFNNKSIHIDTELIFSFPPNIRNDDQFLNYIRDKAKAINNLDWEFYSMIRPRSPNLLSEPIGGLQ